MVKSRLQRMNPLEEQAKDNRMYGDLIALENPTQSVDRPCRGRLRPRRGVIMWLRTVLLDSAGVTKLGPP